MYICAIKYRYVYLKILQNPRSLMDCRICSNDDDRVRFFIYLYTINTLYKLHKFIYEIYIYKFYAYLFIYHGKCARARNVKENVYMYSP